MSGFLTLDVTDLAVPPAPALDALSRRERDVLASHARGRSNIGIAAQLFLSERTVESHLQSILIKLDLAPRPDANRRVLAAASWLSADARDALPAHEDAAVRAAARR